MYVVRFFENGQAGPAVGGPIPTLSLAIENVKILNRLIAESSIVDGTKVVFYRGTAEFGFAVCDEFFGREIKTIDVDGK